RRERARPRPGPLFCGRDNYRSRIQLERATVCIERGRMSEVESSGRAVSASDVPCAVAETPRGWDRRPDAGPAEPAGSDPALRQGLLERLACPVCRVGLALDREVLNCPACGRSFSFAGGRLPILFSPESEFADHEEQYKNWRQTAEDRRPRSYRGRRWLPPTS